MRKFVRDPAFLPSRAALGEMAAYAAAHPLERGEMYREWTPSPANLALLPEPVRHYVAELQRAHDPCGLYRELVCRREQVAAFVRLIEELRHAAGRPRLHRGEVGRIRAMWDPRGFASPHWFQPRRLGVRLAELCREDQPNSGLPPMRGQGLPPAAIPISALTPVSRYEATMGDDWIPPEHPRGATDEWLLHKCLAEGGDPNSGGDALMALYGRYRDAVRNELEAAGLSARDAERKVREVFNRALAVPGGGQPSWFHGYLLRLAREVALESDAEAR